MIRNFSDFCEELIKAGFSVASGGNDEGVFGLITHGWKEAPPGNPIRWHTGDPETDPWEWRMRILDERGDIAYAKLFFRKGGYITAEWYPYFLAARRGDKTFAEEYSDGLISHAAKRIYEAVNENDFLALEEIKRIAGFSREDKSKFDKALTELQMRMHLTMCGRRQKVSQTGKEYGWSSTVFCTAERFFGDDVFRAAADIEPDEAADKIRTQIYKLNPSAQAQKIERFITG